ncbi:MAG: glycosyltransferase family 2 protein [Lentisphaeria bacterium]|nr:glycosyltransferase family 2 protein [Lentisphaeria bacterium]
MTPLTVFTPTFNRKHLLGQCYESLREQTSKDFIWLVVDDGSTDDTESLVREWQQRDNGFEIDYLYKQNGGMHTAHNLAYDTITTELSVCIDSDDHMPKDAVKIILDLWKKHKQERLAGILGLDADTEHTILGTQFERDGMETTLSGFYARGGRGDKKVVLRTDVVNQYPRYPEYPGESLVPLSTLYVMIDQDYTFLATNNALVVVDYQADGSTNTIFKQYRQSPKGFSYARRLQMRYGATFKKRFVSAIHYVSSSIFEKNRRFLYDSPRKIITCAAALPGLSLNVYIRLKTRLSS